MRMLAIKRIVFLLVLLLGYSAVNAADADLITKQITIKLDKAGTLPDKIGSSKKFKITNLKIIGEINGRDLRLIREMAGGTACIGGDAYASTNTKGKLNKLDLSEAIIVGDSENSYAYSVGRDGGVTSYYAKDKDEIPYKMFYNCLSLQEIVIPPCIISIGVSAFESCRYLRSLTIPSGVASIGDYAFRDCGLTSLTLPSSISSIGDNTFEDCSGLTSLFLPSSITSIGIDVNVDEIKYSLKGEAVTSITIPSQMTKVGEYVFQKCKSLTSIYVSWKTPLKLSSTVFCGMDKQKCTLYIPQSTYQDYWLADVWGDFENIVEYDTSGIDKVTDMFDTQEVSRYSVNGQRLSAPTKGLNIVKYSDGSVKKVAVQ